MTRVDWPFAICYMFIYLQVGKAIRGACPCQWKNVCIKSNLTEMVINALHETSIHFLLSYYYLFFVLAPLFHLLSAFIFHSIYLNENAIENERASNEHLIH